MPLKLQAQTSSPAAAPRRLSLGLLTLAVLSTLAASSCCVLSLVLVLVGLTGAWMTHLAVLKPFVGLFTVVALVALGAAGYLVFRPVAAGSACDSADRACASDRVCRNTRRAFLGCALFIAALLLFPYAAPLFY